MGIFNSFEDLKKSGSLTVIILSILSIFASGIFFAIIYFLMGTVQTQFQNTNCDIPNNIYVSSCQELWALSIYPFLSMKGILIWFSYFFIFANVLGLLIIGYRSGKSPALLGLLFVFLIAIVYGSIEISNMYRTMLEIDAFRNMLVDFVVYNKIMLYFPWFTFIVGLLSILLAVVNYQKVKTNLTTEELDY